jgi:hypothetical protein
MTTLVTDHDYLERHGMANFSTQVQRIRCTVDALGFEEGIVSEGLQYIAEEGFERFTLVYNSREQVIGIILSYEDKSAHLQVSGTQGPLCYGSIKEITYQMLVHGESFV